MKFSFDNIIDFIISVATFLSVIFIAKTIFNISESISLLISIIFFFSSLESLRISKVSDVFHRKDYLKTALTYIKIFFLALIFFSILFGLAYCIGLFIVKLFKISKIEGQYVLIILVVLSNLFHPIFCKIFKIDEA